MTTFHARIKHAEVLMSVIYLQNERTPKKVTHCMGGKGEVGWGRGEGEGVGVDWRERDGVRERLQRYQNIDI